MKVSASRRERCRINQEIYRKRHADNLDEGIRTLQEEIQELETHHHNAIRRAPMNESVWIVATEYFRLFRYGYMAPIVAPQSLTPPSRRSHRCFQKVQLCNWKLFSLNGGDVHFQPKRLEQLAPGSLLATTRTSLAASTVPASSHGPRRGRRRSPKAVVAGCHAVKPAPECEWISSVRLGHFNWSRDSARVQGRPHDPNVTTAGQSGGRCSDTVIGGVVQRVAPLHDNNFRRSQASIRQRGNGQRR
ncbi:hypothetical protein GQ600_12359 [Phytophthora cactorum]|nr:hypothetical protein GQ600_12359 [Phytophthora cactorum]